MEGSRVYGGCNDLTPLLDNANNSPWLPPSSSSYRGSMVNFNQAPLVQQQQQPQQQCEQGAMMMNPKRQCYDERVAVNNREENDEDELDANLFGKKRRLTLEQVDLLEKCYEKDNKLEPYRKLDLAKQIGLQPKQVSVWFQNRRARHKSKIVEKEFGSLKDGYNRLKHDYDSLYLEYQSMKLEVEKYKKLLEKHCIAMNTRVASIDDEGIMKMEGQRKVETSDGLEGVVLQCAKLSQEAMSSKKSDIRDYETPHYTVVNQSSSIASPLAIAETFHPCPHPYPDPYLQQLQQQQLQEEHLMMTAKLLLPQTPPTINSIFPLPEDDQPYWSWLC